MTKLSAFFKSINGHPRIGPSHISLYAALVEMWDVEGYKEPFLVKRADVMSLAKVNSISTYHKLLKDLVICGCIRYEPRRDRKGSLIYL